METGPVLVWVGAEGQSTSEPPCLGTEGHVLQGQRQHRLPFSFSVSSLGAQSRLQSLWDKARLGHIWLLGWDRASLGNSGPQTTPLLPAPAAQAGPPPLEPQQLCTLLVASLRTTLSTHQFFSKHLSSLVSSSLPTELGWGAAFVPAQSTGPARVG